MWIPMGISPKKISSFRLNIKSVSDFGSIFITLTEVFTSNLNKKASPCSIYEISDFNTCSKNFFTSYFGDKINCTVPGK